MIHVYVYVHVHYVYAITGVNIFVQYVYDMCGICVYAFTQRIRVSITLIVYPLCVCNMCIISMPRIPKCILRLSSYLV